MAYAVKNLVNAVKKALDKKASFAAGYNAYANSNGDLIARDIRDCNTDIIVFVAGIVEDVAKREKIYSIDALTLAADTGVFVGGTQLPENFENFYETPAENFKEAVIIPADDLKAAALTASRDNTRPILQGVHISPEGYIEACDGFRAYRKKCDSLNPAALDKFESVEGILIHAAVANYDFRGDISVYNGEHYIKLVGNNADLVVYVRKFTASNYIKLDSIYTEKARREITATVKINDLKTFNSVLKTAATAKTEYRNKNGIYLRVKGGKLEYYIEALEVYGVIDSTAANDTAADFYIMLNPRYLMDAVKQGGKVLNFPKNDHAQVFCDDPEGVTSALVLPIRTDGYNPFEKIDRDRRMEKQREQWEEIKARHPEEQEAEAPAPDPETETAAPAEKLEIVPREETPAASVEVIPPEIVKAREIYKKLLACNFKPTKLQEGEADIIYNAYREKLQPIARKAGGLYIDTLAIIAAVMAIYEELEEV